jgi:ABC-2 type transport system permease protein
MMTLFVELTVGNYQSIRSPKRIDPGRTAQKQARPLSALISIGILLVAAGAGWSILTLANNFNLAWLAPLLLLVLAAVAAVIYWRNLEAMDAYALKHRDSLFEELGKKA